MRGQHVIKSWSKRQQVIALSSAEAELYAGLRTASEALGMKALVEDLGDQGDVELLLDATAALAIMSREGLGKVKHIETQHLWIQECVKNKRITTGKVGTKENVSDLGTKHLTEDRVRYLMTEMGFEFVESPPKEERGPRRKA